MTSKASLRVTPLSFLDYVGCKQVYMEAFAETEWPSIKEAWRCRAPLGCWAVRYHGTIVGFSLVSTDNIIKYIAIHPDFQGLRIGTTLLLRTLNDLCDARSIRLTTAGDRRLATWYGRFGFCITNTHLDADGAYIGADMVRRQRCRSAK